ncbi:MAG: DUF2378 family protein [Myxococcota bacterium]|nr:DUF2378 family protein [Myxococcota bacterium]
MDDPKPNSPAARPSSIAPANRVVFGQSFETLFRACGDPPRPEVLAAFRESGVDLDRLQVAYPLAAHLSVLGKVRQLLYPSLSDDEAFFLLGRAFIERYETTLMGRALLRLLPVLGTRRVIGRLTQSFRSATNYVEAEAEERGRGHFEIRIRPVRNPGFYRGILSAGLEVAGAKNLEIKLLGVEGEQISLDVRWTE